MTEEFEDSLKDELYEKELNRLISVAEAAQLLGVSKTTIRRMSNSELIPSYRVGTGRHRRFRKKDIIKILETK